MIEFSIPQIQKKFLFFKNKKEKICMYVWMYGCMYGCMDIKTKQNVCKFNKVPFFLS
jgi:hypothetical protein